MTSDIIVHIVSFVNWVY